MTADRAVFGQRPLYSTCARRDDINAKNNTQAAQIAEVLESVGKDSVVPGLLASTFAGSSDEDIARACEKMRAPPGARWDVSAKIKMRDEKLREVRTMLSRVAEQRRAFGTLVTKIEEKLLKNTREERGRPCR